MGGQRTDQHLFGDQQNYDLNRSLGDAYNRNDQSLDFSNDNYSPTKTNRSKLSRNSLGSRTGGHVKIDALDRQHDLVDIANRAAVSEIERETNYFQGLVAF
jgi:hypothetical protein